MAWQRTQRWHGMYISHMCSLKRIGPGLFGSLLATVWQHYSVWIRHLESVWILEREEETKGEILGIKKVHWWGHWLLSVCLCVCVWEHNPGPAVVIIQWNTPGGQVSLCCSQMILPEGWRDAEVGKERQNGVGLNQGFSGDRTRDAKCARRRGWCDPISVCCKAENEREREREAYGRAAK